LETKINSPQLKVTKLIYLDELTQIPNRRYFNAQFPSIWNECREKSVPLALLMIDIDWFKRINDTYFHETGDEVLQKTASLMAEILKDKGILIRFAGDEFIILLPEADSQEAELFGHDLVSFINQSPLEISKIPIDYHISLSVGIVVWPTHTESKDELLEKADQALYLSKESGRNRSTLYEKEKIARFIARKGGVQTPCKYLLQRNDILFSIRAMLDTDSTSFAIPRILSGPLGIGKTTVLKTIETKNIISKRILPVYIRCFPYFLNHPFKTIIQILDKIISLDMDLLHLIEPEHLERFSFLLPSTREFLEKQGKKPSPLDEKNLPEIIEKSFKIILKNKKTLICLDDIDYCDQESSEILDRAANSESSPYFFLVAGCSENEPSHFFKDRFPAIEANKKYKLHYLQSIDETSIRSMLRYIFKGAPYSSKLLNAVCLRSKGNPLFVEELIKYMNDKQVIFFEQGTWTIKDNWADLTPLGLNDLILEGIKTLDDITREILSHAALIGQDFDLLTLENLELRNEGQIIDVLEQAKKADFLTEETKEGEETYIFTNESVTTAFSDMVPQEEIKPLHNRIAEIQHALGGENMWRNLGKILYHYKLGEKLEPITDLMSKLSIQPDSSLISQDLREFLKENIPEKDWGEEEELSDEDVLNALMVIKYIRNAIQSISLYPTESKIVQASSEKIFSDINTILKNSPTLTYNATAELILINGIRPDLKEYRKNMGPFLKKLMSDMGFKGISFKKGLTLSEIKNFIILLSKKPDKSRTPKEWDDALIKQNIDHIVLNHRIYVAVGERDIQKAEKGIIIDETPRPAPSPISPEDIQLFKQLLKPELDESLKDTLKGSLSVEKIESFISLLEEVIKNKNLEESQGEEEKVDESIAEEVFKDSDEDLNLYLEKLTSPDSQEALDAARKLIEADIKAVDEIVKYISRCDELKGRKYAFKVLKKINPKYISKLTPEMLHHRGADVPIKILTALDEDQQPEMKEIIRQGLFHPDPRVKAEAVILLEDKNKQWYKELMLEYFKEGISIKSVRAIVSAGKTKLKEVAPFLITQLTKKGWHRRDDDVILQTQICRTLGQFHDFESAKALIKAAENPPFWRGRNKLNIKVRLAAIETLGSLKGVYPEITEALERISKDKNPELKQAAINALGQKV
jgi:diguanylate cyclase (GGDEF)-like protein